MLDSFWSKKEIIDSKEEIILFFRFSVFIFSDRLPFSVSDMVLMGILGVFVRSMEGGCLVLGVAKDKSFAGRLEHSNYSILKSTTL